jgi:prephenate dehydratase
MAAQHAPLPRVAFQGELGAFSEQAIRQQWPGGAEAVPSASFAEAVSRVLDGAADFAIIPLENAIAGPVREGAEALAAAEGRLSTRAEVRMAIHLCLMAPPGATLAGLRQVQSHGIALAQCRIFFARHGWLEPVVHTDTAGAARDVAATRDRSRGAVASALAAERYGLEIIARNIEDIPANFTRFVVVSRAGQATPAE